MVQKQNTRNISHKWMGTVVIQDVLHRPTKWHMHSNSAAEMGVKERRKAEEEKTKTNEDRGRLGARQLRLEGKKVSQFLFLS